MQHPLINDLSEKSMDELQKTIGDLQMKLSFAVRSGNGHLCNQIRMALESYQNAFQNKVREETKKFEENGELNFDKIQIQ